MATYSQLLAEAVWRAQFVPPNLDLTLIRPLRSFYGLGPAEIGAPGDNNHLYGRHRSANWDRKSIYCTNRTYGTTDARDKRGGQDWYRALDIGIKGQTLYDACRRLDAAVRAGQIPGLAEWFGTFDGVHVVGWYEGHPSSSDSSHLYHCHVGLWNQYADDPVTLQAVYDTVTGQGDDMGVSIFKDQTGQLWLTDMMVRRKVENAAVDTVIYYLQQAGVKVFNATAGGSIVNFADPNHPEYENAMGLDVSHLDEPVGDLVLTPEQLAEVTAAAQAGAEAGAPTAQELEDAAFEGAQRAEDQ